jgi:hypothetical protein
VNERSPQEKAKLLKVSSRLFRLTSHFSKSTSQHEEITADLVKELGKVRMTVLREYQRLQGLVGSDAGEVSHSNEEKDLVSMARRKRLLLLFVKDLSSGLGGDVLSSKSRRDSEMSRGKSVSSKINRVSWQAKGVAGVFVALLDGGMLFYVYLFAMNQTSSRQKAWFISFVMWLGFEIFLSSTAFVLVLHLLVPLYVWSDVAEVKKKVLTDLIEFRNKYMKRNDIETGLLSAERSNDFNAAKYLFSSWRVASLFPDLPESQLVLRFSTPWPKKKFGKEEGNVAKEYEDDAILTAASRILLYFLTSLLNYSSLVQDILIQTVCNGTLGSLLVLLVQLWNVYPWLAVVAVLVLLLCVYGLGRYSVRDLAKKLETAEVEEAQEDVKLKEESPASAETTQGHLPSPILLPSLPSLPSHLSLAMDRSSEAMGEPVMILVAGLPPAPPADESESEKNSESSEDSDSDIDSGEEEDDDDLLSFGGVGLWESQDSSSEGEVPPLGNFFVNLKDSDSDGSRRGSDDSEAPAPWIVEGSSSGLGMAAVAAVNATEHL